MFWTNRTIFFAGFCLGLLFRAGTVVAQSSENRGHAAYSQLQSSSGLEFIPNLGQLSDQFGKPMPEVLYTLDGYGMKSYFTKGSMHYVFSKLNRTSLLKKERVRGEVGAMTMQDSLHDTLSLYR